jgi:hypothetical protein
MLLTGSYEGDPMPEEGRDNSRQIDRDEITWPKARPKPAQPRQ